MDVILCNLIETTAYSATGSLGYILVNHQGGSERFQVLIRSRSGRFIQHWIPTDNLGNFRIRRISPENPRYKKLLKFGDYYHPEQTLEWIKEDQRKRDHE